MLFRYGSPLHIIGMRKRKKRQKSTIQHTVTQWQSAAHVVGRRGGNRRTVIVMDWKVTDKLHKGRTLTT